MHGHFFKCRISEILMNWKTWGGASIVAHVLLQMYLNFQQIRHRNAVMKAWLENNELINRTGVCPRSMHIYTRDLYPECPDEVANEIMAHTYRMSYSYRSAALHGLQDVCRAVFYVVLLPHIWPWAVQLHAYMDKSSQRTGGKTIDVLPGWITFAVLKLIGKGPVILLLFGEHLLSSLVFLPFYYELVMQRFLAGLFWPPPSFSLMLLMAFGSAVYFAWTMQISLFLTEYAHPLFVLLVPLASLVYLRLDVASELATSVPLSSTPYMATFASFVRKHCAAFRHPIVVKAGQMQPSYAFMMGAFGQYVMSLYESLIVALMPNEAMAILAHELGHWTYNHCNVLLLLDSLRIILVYGVYKYILSHGVQLCADFGISFASDDFEQVFYQLQLSYLLTDMMLSSFLMLLKALLNAFSRCLELQADAFAVHIGFGPELSKGLETIIKDTLSTHPHVTFWSSRHPDLPTRQAHIKALLLRGPSNYHKPSRQKRPLNVSAS